MIDKEDILQIKDLVSKIKDTLLKKNEDTNIDIIDLDKFNNLDEDFVFIDSSHASGIVGPISYVYLRAVAISRNKETTLKDYIIFPDIFIDVFEKKEIKSLEISDLASVFSKNLEYRLAWESKERYKIIDGSLVSDFVLFQKIIGSPIEEINGRIQSYRENFYNSDKIKLISIAKRILHSKLFKSQKPDFIILLNKYPFETFCTKVIYKDLDERKIKACYIRARKYEHIYRIESWNNMEDEEFYSIIKTIFYEKAYPYLLKMAHNLCKIKNKEKNLIEEIIKRELGIDKSVGWETK
ncbi:MAG: DNA double-strand break repair nuclease NurA [Nanopusillaceae archaeon]